MSTWHTHREMHTHTKLSLGKQTWQKLLTSAQNKQLQRPGRSLPLLPRPSLCYSHHCWSACAAVYDLLWQP